MSPVFPVQTGHGCTWKQPDINVFHQDKYVILIKQGFFSLIRAVESLSVSSNWTGSSSLIRLGGFRLGVFKLTPFSWVIFTTWPHSSLKISALAVVTCGICQNVMTNTETNVFLLFFSPVLLV